MALTLLSAQDDELASGQRRPIFRGTPPSRFTGPLLHVDASLPEVGTILRHRELGPAFHVLSRFHWPGEDNEPCVEGCWAKVLTHLRISPHGLPLFPEKQGAALAWVTLSDKGYAGRRPDAAGPMIADVIGKALVLSLIQGFLLPDDPARLRSLLMGLALEQGFDLIVTTGGTGVAPSDHTPEATLSVLEKRLPGMETAMLMAALAKTPHAVISRAVAGTLGKSLIINLPGSPKAVAENLQALLPALEHTLAKLRGDPSDCAA